MLEQAGIEEVRRALSGHVALLSGDYEVSEAGREHVLFGDGPITVELGPVRGRPRTIVTGVAIYDEDGRRVVTESFDQNRVLFAGQSLTVTLEMDPRPDG